MIDVPFIKNSLSISGMVYKTSFMTDDDMKVIGNNEMPCSDLQ